jgi:hypothetical protein
MLAHEWHELEMLCERIGALRERLAAACKTGNTGLIDGLNSEIDRTTRQRELLVRHISTRLGSTADDRRDGAGPDARREPRAGGGSVAIPH